MASNDTLFVAEATAGKQPNTSYARWDERNGHKILKFGDSATEDIDFRSFLPRNYAGGGLTLTIAWCPDSASSGNVIWMAKFERDNAGQSIAADSFAGAQSAAAASAAGGASVLVYTTIAFTNGQIDGLLAGEAFRLRVSRDGGNGSDTMTGDAFLESIECKET